MEKTLISPNKIKIIEGTLDFVTDGTWKNRIVNYLKKYDAYRLITDKSVIAIHDKSGDLIALDGNKLCFAGRLVVKQVQCIVLENEIDKTCLDSFIYNSQMIWNNSINEVAYQEHYDFFNNAKGSWIFDVPRCYSKELISFGIQFQIEQMIFYRT